MTSNAKNLEEYIASLPDDRKSIISEIIKTFSKNLPKGFETGISYGMVGFCVPHSLYPKGYHCDPKQPLPFAGVASQKNHISIYHMGIYAHKPLLDWFLEEWNKHSTKKLDMGKSCIRFKKPEDVPLKLIGELAKKMTTKQWIEIYESNFHK